MEFEDFYQKRRAELKTAGLLRKPKTPHGVDFCSNDYLGLSVDENLRSQIIEKMSFYSLGSGGSRLLRGHSLLIEELESELASFSKKQEALFFSTGYQANLALFSSLLKHEARVFSDEKNHASIIDGIRLSGAEKFIWKHSQMDSLECLLKQKSNEQKMNFVVVESIYSMDGDFAPLKDLVFLCEKYHCHLIVDEAHATGLFGKGASGLVEYLGLCERVFARVHTGGKALGVSGAWVAGPSELKDFMIQHSRPFIYSTAPGFPQQLALLESIRYLLKNKQQLIKDFFGKVKLFQDFIIPLAEKFDFQVGGRGGPVTSFVVGENKKALDLMEAMATKGYDVRAIRYPSVPPHRALLRMTVPVQRTFLEIQSFCEHFKKSLETLV